MNSFSCVITGHRPTRLSSNIMKRINAANGLKSVCRSNSYDFITREYDAFGLEEQWALICGQRRYCCA